MQDNVPIRVLYIYGGIMARGGIEAFMMNYYRHFDREKVQIDFVVHGHGKGVYDDEIEKMGGRIIHVPLRLKDPIGNKVALQKLFLSGEYKVVHSHMDAMNAWSLQIAKKCGIPVRISHSHNTAVISNSRIKKLLHNVTKKRIPKVATHLLACSGLAGAWLYGDHEYQVIPNAIDIERFSYDAEKRQKLRQALGYQSTDIVLGHVGRFDTQKNHVFLIDIMKKLVACSDRYQLLMIGDGDLKSEIMQKVQELGLTDRIKILNACPNVNEYYNVFDCFCLPSLFEGLGIVGIEAQVNGLTCVISDTVPKELDITGNMHFLPIGNDNIDAWINILMNVSTKRNHTVVEKASQKHYDICTSAKILQAIYTEALEY